MQDPKDQSANPAAAPESALSGEAPQSAITEPEPFT